MATSLRTNRPLWPSTRKRGRSRRTPAKPERHRRDNLVIDGERVEIDPDQWVASGATTPGLQVRPGRRQPVGGRRAATHRDPGRVPPTAWGSSSSTTSWCTLAQREAPHWQPDSSSRGRGAHAAGQRRGSAPIIDVDHDLTFRADAGSSATDRGSPSTVPTGRPARSRWTPSPTSGPALAATRSSRLRLGYWRGNRLHRRIHGQRRRRGRSWHR